MIRSAKARVEAPDLSDRLMEAPRQRKVAERRSNGAGQIGKDLAFKGQDHHPGLERELHAARR